MQPLNKIISQELLTPSNLMGFIKLSCPLSHTVDFFSSERTRVNDGINGIFMEYFLIENASKEISLDYAYLKVPNLGLVAITEEEIIVKTGAGHRPLTWNEALDALCTVKLFDEITKSDFSVTGKIKEQLHWYLFNLGYHSPQSVQAEIYIHPIN